MADGINPNIRRKKRSLKDTKYYLEGLERGDRYVLSEVLTVIESTTAQQRTQSLQILNTITSEDSNTTIRIGITGSPGAGKSTMIEQVGLHYISKGKKVAVLAIDPSSVRTDGSILGDKTRMPLLSTHEDAYVRPSASAAHLGGVSRTTRESIAICEKAGYDIIIIESVGVGQSEVELADLVDVYVLVLLPGGGDDVQAIKRGVVEMADLLVINKSDGDREQIAKHSQRDYRGSMIHFPHSLEGWQPPVMLTSALTGVGIEALCGDILKFVKSGKETDYFDKRRESQDGIYLKSQIRRYIESKVEKEYMELIKSSPSDSRDSSVISIFKFTQDILEELAKKFHI